MTKKVQPKLQLNVDLKKYLDKNLAKDNLNLIKKLEEADKKIQELEKKLTTQELDRATKKDKALRNIHSSIYKIYDSLDCINVKEVKNDLNTLLKIDSLPLNKLINIVYSLTDADDGSLLQLAEALPKIIDLYHRIDDYLEEISE